MAYIWRLRGQSVFSLIKSEFCIFNVTVSPGTITTVVILKIIVDFLLILWKVKGQENENHIWVRFSCTSKNYSWEKTTNNR